MISYYYLVDFIMYPLAPHLGQQPIYVFILQLRFPGLQLFQYPYQ
jgi:hypothetical protein